RMQMRLQLRECHPLIDRRRVSHDMKIVSREIDNAVAVLILDERAADVPFVGNCPVECLCSRGYFVDGHRRNDARQIRQSFAHATPGERAADREKIANPRMHFRADCLRHAASSKSESTKRLPSSFTLGSAPRLADASSREDGSATRFEVHKSFSPRADAARISG